MMGICSASLNRSMYWSSSMIRGMPHDGRRADLPYGQDGVRDAGFESSRAGIPRRAGAVASMDGDQAGAQALGSDRSTKHGKAQHTHTHVNMGYHRQALARFGRSEGWKPAAGCRVQCSPTPCAGRG